jgi:spore germination protein GerM
VSAAARRVGAARTVRAVGVALALLASTATGAACGLGANDEPQPLARDDVPPDLLNEHSSEPTAVNSGVETTEVTVYFLQSDEDGGRRMVPLARQVPVPGDAESRIQALITQPPDEDERADGISTAVPADASILSRPVHTDDGVLVVNLSDNFYDLQGDSSRHAFAQVVFTATEVPQVDRVRFELRGNTFPPVDGDGQTRRGAVGRDAYRSLLSDE